MRALPAGWPDPADLVQEIPVVYLRLPGSSWPPASVVDDEALPAGTARVGEWSITCDLDAPLMPGQITPSPKFTIAEASCTIPQPEGALLAPWRGGGEAPPKTARCELIASYDGPNGATAFVLGRFILDPIKGKLSDPSLSLTMMQDLVRLKRDHTLPTRPNNQSWGNCAAIIQYAAAVSGYGFEQRGGFPAAVDFTYFPRKTNMLDAIQQVAAANLAAMFLSMDGSTIRALGPSYLRGEGGIVETIDVASNFEDISWTQDPGAVADRVEVTYVPPKMATGGEYPAPFDHAAVWTAAKNQGISAGGTLSFEFDPGSYIAPFLSGSGFGSLSGTFQIMANQWRTGSGDDVVLTGTITHRSSGNWAVSIHNHTGAVRYLVLPWDPPPRVEDGTVMVGQDRGWGAAKGTPSFIPGTIDTATDSEATMLAWGVPADEATNTLQFSLGRNVQNYGDVATIFGLIVNRVQSASYVFDDVNVAPHLGRELADLDQLVHDAAGFNAKAMVTGIKTSGDATGIRQSLSLAILG